MNTSGLSRGNFLCVWTAVGGLVLAPACFGQNHPAKFNYFAIPTQSYAVVDISGSSTAADVTMLALADGNTAAFAFQTTDNICKSYLWQNGAATLAQSFPLTGYGHFGDGDGNDIIYPGLVTTTGEVEGSFYGNWPPGNPYSYPYPNGTFYANGGVVSAPITVDGIDYAEDLALTQTADGRFGTVIYGGFGNLVGSDFSLLQIGGANTVFMDEIFWDHRPDPPGWRVVGVPDLDGGFTFADTFVPYYQRPGLCHRLCKQCLRFLGRDQSASPGRPSLRAQRAERCDRL